MEVNGLADALQDGTFQVVVQQDPGHSVERFEGGHVSAQEVGHRLCAVEAQEDTARVAEHHHESPQRPHRPADGELAEVPPVHLGLFARQRAQPQIRFGHRARAVARHHVAEVIRPSAIAALRHHLVEAAGAQARVLLQRFADQRHEGVDDGRPQRHRALDYPRLGEHPAHRVVMHAEFGGDGADLPLLGIPQPQNLGLPFARDHG